MGFASGLSPFTLESTSEFSLPLVLWQHPSPVFILRAEMPFVVEVPLLEWMPLDVVGA
jgi:hypothetical protein